MQLPGDPGIDLAIAGEQPVRPNEASGVEDDPRPAAIDFEERARLDIDTAIARLANVAVGVLVGNGNSQPVGQLGNGRVDRSGVGELGKTTSLTSKNGS